jgi:leader peptidase (prepilin peptidase)/N-methyltransferase
VTALTLGLVGLLGLVIGSFLNVVVRRVPRGESLLSAPARCPACDAPVRLWHTVPVVGWLVRRGRCAAGGERLSVRHPVVEVGTAVLFVLVALRLSALGELAALPAFLYFGALGVALALIDLDVRRLPDALVLPSYPVLALLLAGAAWWRGDWSALLRAALGAAALFAFYFAVAFIHPAGMGFGDVKLAGLVGGVLAWLSWPTLAIGAFAGFLLGAIVGVALIAAGHAGRKTVVPFGPFMVAGTLLGVFLAEPVADWYAGLLGLD